MWDIFINTIKEVGLDSGSPEQIIIALFEHAGYINKKEDGLTEATARSWIRGKRKCKVYSYFPSGKITNPEAVYKYFRRRPEDKLKKLQQVFSEKKDDDSPIDCETEDLDRFCWSLVNQFLDLLCLQRLELPGETSTKQMREIFEKAVMDYNITVYICKLSDYLMGEAFYGSDIFAFNDVIGKNILSRFAGEQNEKIYKMISEFKLALETYSGFLSIIRLSVSKEYGFMLRMGGFNNEIFSLIDSECDEIRKKLDSNISLKEGINESSVSEFEEKLTQLDFIRNILLSHKRLCDLFEKICPGKTILVFQ